MGKTYRDKSNLSLPEQSFFNDGKGLYLVNCANLYIPKITWIVNQDQASFRAGDDTAYAVRLINTVGEIGEIVVEGNMDMRKYTFVVDCLNNSAILIGKITSRKLGNPDPSYDHRNHDIIKIDATSYAECDLIDAEDVGDTLVDCKGRGVIRREIGNNIYRRNRVWNGGELSLGDVEDADAMEDIWDDGGAGIVIDIDVEPPLDPPEPPAQKEVTVDLRISGTIKY